MSTNQPSPSPLPYVVMLASPLFFSTNLIFGRYVTGEVAPFLLATMRWGAVALILSPLLVMHRASVVPLVQAQWRRLALLGILGNGHLRRRHLSRAEIYDGHQCDADLHDIAGADHAARTHFHRAAQPCARSRRHSGRFYRGRRHRAAGIDRNRPVALAQYRRPAGVRRRGKLGRLFDPLSVRSRSARSATCRCSAWLRSSGRSPTCRSPCGNSSARETHDADGAAQLGGNRRNCLHLVAARIFHLPVRRARARRLDRGRLHVSAAALWRRVGDHLSWRRLPALPRGGNSPGHGGL